MYAVIFKARLRPLDDAYYETAHRMRELAMQQYGCLDFVSSTENDFEISISYWNSERDIRAWRQDPEHQRAQLQGRDNWYLDYEVEVLELQRRYTSRDP